MAEKPNNNGLDKKFRQSKKAIAFMICTVVLGGLAGLSIGLDREWTASVVMACTITIGVVCSVLILGQAAVDKLLARAVQIAEAQSQFGPARALSGSGPSPEEHVE